MDVEIPTAPDALPIIGHAWSMVHDPERFLLRLADYDGLVRVKFGPVSAVVVCDPQLLRQILERDHIFDKGGALFERANDALGNGLATCPFSEHRRIRAAVQPAFTPGMIDEYAPEMLRRITDRVNAWSAGQVLDLNTEMQNLTATTTLAILFDDAATDAQQKQMIHDMTALFEGVFKRAFMPRFLGSIPIANNVRYIESVSRLRDTLRRLLAERREEPERESRRFIDIIQATSGPGSVSPLTDDEIADQLITFFIAGSDTTASALVWALYYLDRHPAIASRLHGELSAITNSNPIEVTDVEAVRRLPLLNHVIIETLRLRGPLWCLTRKSAHESTVGGYRIRGGETIIYSNHLLHHQESTFRDPVAFDPDRWPSTANYPASQFNLFPFGFGPRKCVGDKFAMTEMAIALAVVVLTWRTTVLPSVAPRISRSVMLRPDKMTLRVDGRR